MNTLLLCLNFQVDPLIARTSESKMCSLDVRQLIYLSPRPKSPRLSSRWQSLEIVDETRFVTGMGGRINASRLGLVSEIEESLTKQFPANKSLEQFFGGGRGSWGRSATAQLGRWAASSSGSSSLDQPPLNSELSFQVCKPGYNASVSCVIT